jgi:hypothetical protein
MVAVSPIEQALGEKLEVPDIITFVCSPNWLNRPDLYPRQGTPPQGYVPGGSQLHAV